MPLIAVVDDEPPVQTMLRRVLGLARYEVVTYGSGEELLESLAGPAPACIVLDVHLPGMSGIAVAEHLRTAAPGIPLILITGSDDPSLEAAAQAAGALRLLRKPFPMDMLHAAIRDALHMEDQS